MVELDNRGAEPSVTEAKNVQVKGLTAFSRDNVTADLCGPELRVPDKVASGNRDFCLQSWIG